MTAEPAAAGHAPRCRFCAAPLELTVVDLGMSPLCESFLAADQLDEMEPFYPLHVRACERCWLVQLRSFVAPDEIFTEYAYFSAYSTSWVEHAREYVEMIRERLGLGPDDLVVELASNDGYLLQHFVGTGVPILGIDPAANVAQAAEERGVPTLVAFFGARARASGSSTRAQRADLIARQQRPRPGSRSQRLRRRRRRSLLRPAAPRRSSSRTSCACSTACSTTRSTTSTSRTSRSRRSRRSSRPTVSRSTTSRSCGRTAARCASTRSTPAGRTRVAARSRALLAREEARRPALARALRRASPRT